MNQNRKTILSAEGKPIYRYVLWREWDESNSRYAMFVGLNPSTADETNDDPTIGRCVSFAKDASCGALCMTNLFAFRTKSPALMKMQKNISPVGLDNDDWLLKCAQNASVVIAAWGTHGNHLQHDRQVAGILGKSWCLGKTQFGFPRHPLLVKKGTKLIPFVF